MKFFMRLLVLLLFALAVAGFAKFNSGQVTFYMANYRADLSLNLLIAGWLFSFVLFYYAIRLYINLGRLPTKIRRARVKNALILSRRHLNYAGLHYFEGKYRSCYNEALKSLGKEFSLDNQFLAYMLAFRAASIMRDSAKEAKILAEISQFKEAKWQLAKHLLIAENLYNDQQYGQCLDNLNIVLQLDHKHVPARRMVLKVYLHLANYHKAYEELGWLLKNDSLREYKAIKYQARVLSGLFAQVADHAELNRIYNKLSKTERTSFLYAKLYFEALLRLGAYHQAVAFLDAQQKDHSLAMILSDSILALAKRPIAEDLLDSLVKISDKYLLINRNSSELLLALGILSYRKKEWDKARRYLEASTNLNASIDGYLYLALVASASDDQQLSASCQANLLTQLQNFK